MAVKNYNGPAVDVLLSTYNGVLYLSEQIDSILAQTHRDWRLTIRDDGSTDDTVEIIKRYCALYPGKITLVKDTAGRLGPCQSFARLLGLSTAPYAMFCDQDDVWLPEKIELTLKEMKRLEESSKGSSVLIHTDMKVVDRNMKVIAESFWKYQHLDPGMRRTGNLLIMNNVTGCTMMINNKLREISLPIPGGAILHDWWINLVASAFGRIGYVDSPTLLYRQHGENEAGASSYPFNYLTARVVALDNASNLMRRIVRQAQAFFSAYGGRLPEEERRRVSNFASMLEKGRLARIYTMIKNGHTGYGFLRNLGVLVLLFSMGKGGAAAGEKRGFRENG